jgi:hypothetical protein
LLTFAENVAAMESDTFGPMTDVLAQLSEEVGHLRYELFGGWRQD